MDVLLGQDSHFLRVKQLGKQSTRASSSETVLLNVMEHNLREIVAEIGVGAHSNIDPSRSHMNIILYGLAEAAAVADLAKDLMRKSGVTKIRKNATVGIEVLFALPSGLQLDYGTYFNDAMRWAQKHFAVPMLSAVIHNDESNPHMHVVLLPVREGRLIGSELLGDRSTTKAMHKSFHEQVGMRHGLRQPTTQKRLSASDRRRAIDSARTMLEANSGLNDAILRALLDPHLANPAPLLSALGLPMPAPEIRKGQTFAGIMTKPCKPGKKPNRTFETPIGELPHQGLVKIEPGKQCPILCIGDPNSPQPNDNAEPQRTDADKGDYKRERDTDIVSEYWDAERGEFVVPPVRNRGARI